eukprot:CAMPEP_0204913188 /NCGR_PEP_ID=MMETSP1397-20131031/11156_1 /ASSEMBLY_ACC=CAM_ASM_000891 /TAXON_ID=49980 /ORGANISM="Climacostomum Climacostomum virens, Strain Stock W-24" /LENGTH=2321 /DNA_ID=CAMNT_0052084377 /DNA_START=78 /DNA_END=7040 /DNA_ORIENTATION=-
MYLAAEGLAQMTAFAVRSENWWLHSNECLFRIESFQPALELKEHRQLEELAQSTAFKKCRGQRVHFGQNVQLRHVLSGKLLSLELKHKATGTGLWKVSVSKQSPNCAIAILPYLNSRQQGEGINFNDGLTLAFEVENLLYYLSATATNDIWEVAIVNKPSVWRAHLFRDSSIPKDVLSVGTPLMITKKITEMKLSIGDGRSIISKSPDDFNAYWVLTSSRDLAGGSLSISTEFYIRNVATKQFLTHDLGLADNVTEKDLFTFKRVAQGSNKSKIVLGETLTLMNSFNQILYSDKSNSLEWLLQKIFETSKNTANSQEAKLTNASNLTKLSLVEITSLPKQDQDFMMKLMAVKPAFRSYLQRLERLGVGQYEEYRFLFWRDLEIVEFASERIRGAAKKIMKMMGLSRNTDEFKARQAILVGLDFHRLLIEILRVCTGMFDENTEFYVREVSFRKPLEGVKTNTLEPCFDLLEKIAQENSMTSKKLYPFAEELYTFMNFSPKTCSLLTQIYAYVDIVSDDIRKLLQNWTVRLAPVNLENIHEQPNFFRILRNLCEVNEEPVERIQNEMIEQLQRGYFPLKAAYSKPDGFLFVLQDNYEHATQGLDDRLKAAFSTEGVDRVAVNLKMLRSYEDYVKYFQDLLVLIYTLSINNLKGQEFARSLGLTPRLLLKMSTSKQLHLSLRLACLFLLDTSYLRVNKPMHNKYSNLSYSIDQLAVQKTSPFALVDGNEELTQQIVKYVLGFFLSPKMPEELSCWSKGKQLIYFKAILTVVKSLIKYNHVNKAFYKTIECVLSYVIVGFNPSGQEHTEEHWLLAFLKDYSENVQTDLVVRLKLTSVFNRLISVMEMLQKHSQQELLEEALRIYVNHSKLFETSPFNGLPEDEASAEFYKSISELLDPDRDQKFLREVEKIYCYRAESHREDTKSRSKMIADSLYKLLRKESPFKYYLMRVGMLSSEIGPEIRARLLGIAKTVFRSDFHLMQKLSKVDLFVDTNLMELTRFITQQIQAYENAHREISNETFSESNIEVIGKLGNRMVEFCNLLSPKAQPMVDLRWKTQNIMRHKSLHIRVMKFLSTMKALVDHNTLTRKAQIICFIFLSLFIKGNEQNKAAVRQNIDLNIFDFAIPGASELIKDLVGFTSLSTYDICSLYKYAIKKIDPRDPSTLTYLNLLTSNMVNEKVINSDAQNIISRFLVKAMMKIFPITEHTDCTVIGRMLIVLANCTIDNLSVSIQVKKMLSRETITELAEYTNSPILLLGLCEIFLKAFIKSRQGTDTGKYSPALEILLMVSATFIEKLLTSDKLPALVAENTFSIVYNKKSPVDFYTEPHDLKPELKEEFELWNFLICHEYGYQSGLISILEALVEYSHGLPLGRLQLIVRDLRQIKSKLEEVAKDSTFDFGYMISSIHTCIDKVSSYLRVHHPNLVFEALTNYAGITIGKQFKSLLSKPGARTSLQSELDRTFGNFRSTLDEYMSIHSLKGHIYITQMRDYLLRNHIMRNALNGELEKTDFEEANKLLKTMRQSFIEYGDQELYFKLLKELIPDGESRVAAAEFFKDAITDAVKVVSCKRCSNITLAAARFMEAIFTDQPIELLLNFKKTIDEHDLTFELFSMILYELKMSSDRVHRRAKGNDGKLFGHMSSATFLMFKGAKVAGIQGLKKRTSREKFIVSMINVLQLCCDNLNIDFQRYMGDQKASLKNGVDLDLVTGIANYIVDISDESGYLLADREAPEMITSCLATLIDFVTGPCPENQILLGTNVQLMLAMNRLVDCCKSSTKPKSAQILKSLVKFMLTLFEGNYDPSISQNVMRFFNLKSLMGEAEHTYATTFSVKSLSIVQESSETDETEIEQCKTGVLIGMLWLQLKKDHPSNPIFTDSRVNYSGDMFNKVSKFIGYVEIRKDEQTYSCYFPVPFKMKFLTQHSQVNMVMDVSKDSHKAKLDDFLKAIDEYRFEMQYHQHLSKNLALKYFSSKWQVWSRVAFCMILFLNYFLLKSVDYEEEDQAPEVSPALFTFVGILQLIFSFMAYVFHQVEFYPNLLYRSFKEVSDFDVDQFFDVPNNDSVWMRHMKLEQQDGTNTNYFAKRLEWRYLRLALTDTFTMYYLCYWIASLSAFRWPLCYSILMLDFMKQQPELFNLLKAITLNLKPLLLTALLGIIWIFVFSLMAFLWFWKAYDAEQGLFCDTLFDCLISSLHIGIRNGGGIGDSLNAEEGGFTGFRVVFELSFWVIVIVILMNVIFGIIIDTFGELRDQRNSLKKEIHNNCFICGEARSQIELHGQGWSHHFMCLHSPFAYVAFIVHVVEQPANDCNGIEKYVKSLVQARDTSFFP